MFATLFVLFISSNMFVPSCEANGLLAGVEIGKGVFQNPFEPIFGGEHQVEGHKGKGKVDHGPLEGWIKNVKREIKKQKKQVKKVLKDIDFLGWTGEHKHYKHPKHHEHHVHHKRHMKHGQHGKPEWIRHHHGKKCIKHRKGHKKVVYLYV